MDSPFNTIGLIGKPNHPGAAATLQRISQFIDSPQRLTAVGNASTDDALFALVSG